MKNFKKFAIIIISILIIFSCAYFKTIKEALTNNDNNILLLGDSVLNNSNYVPQGKSVLDNLKKNTNNVFNYAKDGATINDLYAQLDEIPLELNTSKTSIFISAGGNDILNKHGKLDSTEITNLFNTYLDFLDALRVKLGSANLNIINLYLPANPRYNSYKPSIQQWNQLIEQHSNEVGETYSIININTLLTTAEDFVYNIEPSVIGSEKIANLIYLSR